MPQPIQLFNRTAKLQVASTLIEDLRFKFEVERGLRPTPGKAKIEIFNLNPTNRQAIEALASVPVILQAGYDQNTTVLFSGTLRRATTMFDATNAITKIEGQDGGTRRRTARVNRSFRPGTPLRTVLEAIAAAMGVGVGNLPDIAPTAALVGAGQTFTAGTVLSGNAAEELDGLCRSAGLEWSIQNGNLQLLPLRSALAGQAVVLSPDTGMVGFPEKGSRDKIKVRSLIIPGLAPGRIITVQSKVLQGSYRVDRATWTGDTRGQDWYVECEASPYGRTA
jgi:hypothetical protein